MRRLTMLLPATLAALSIPGASAQCPPGYAPLPPGRVVRYQVLPAPVGVRPVYQAASLVPTLPVVRPAAAAAQGADWFVSRLNAIRAQHGLPAVAYDPAAAAAAATNNALQRTMGLGHHAGGGYWQNAGWGAADPFPMWLASEPHRATLLHPAITAAGGASDGTYTTLNAR